MSGRGGGRGGRGGRGRGGAVRGGKPPRSGRGPQRTPKKATGKNPYVADSLTQKAKDEGYAARSVYKLTEIQRRFALLRPGQRVVDLGCFPGSWSRYVRQVVGPKGTLVGVDLETPDVPGGTWITRSVYDVSAEELMQALGGPADVVVSDMAPRTTGNRLGDHVQQIALARRALEVAVATLKPGGAFVVKVFEGEEAAAFRSDVKAHFERGKSVRPEAVRKVSREFFYVALGFRGRPDAADA